MSGDGAWQLAQVNVGRLVAPVDDPSVAGFVDGLAPVNASADAAPGFVWRLQTTDGDATAVRISPDELVIVNLSVWASLEALRQFVFRTGHAEFLRRRREWFEPYGSVTTALWWVPAGHVPDIAEAVERLALLEQQGPTPAAFTFRQPFEAPGHGRGSPDGSRHDFGNGGRA